jgi:GR25 family glycosyltransferase involved in LPS biosynthesis
MSNPFDFFKKVCYINLDDRLDRNDQIKTELNKYNINSERISAIRLSEEESEILTQKGYPLCEPVSDLDAYHRDRIKKVTLGQRSCLMSHLKIYQYAKDNNIDNVLIFEDDMIFNDDVDVIDVLSKTIEELKNVEWDMFFLGCMPLSPMIKRGEYLYQLTHLSTSHSYVINSSCYDTLLNFPFYEEMNIDTQFSKFAAQNKIKSFTSKYPLTFQREDFSDIQMLPVGGLENHIKSRYKTWTG